MEVRINYILKFELIRCRKVTELTTKPEQSMLLIKEC